MTDQINNGHVSVKKHDGIASIEFFHPQSNSLPGLLLEKLASQVTAAGLDEETRVIVLRSSGEKVFCAGASFDELLAIQNEEQGLAFFSGFANLINAMRKCPKFIIARVQGKAVGGGVGLAAAADHAIAMEGADIKLSELAVGIGPFVVGPAVKRKIGLSAFSSIAIDATTWRSAEWAKNKGLYAELHAGTEAMDQSVQRLASSLAGSNPQAMAKMKENFWEGTGHWDQLLIERAAVSGRLIMSEFSKQAIEQFKKK